MNVLTYLFFEGCCEEAIEFYRRVLDAKVDTLMRYRESPDPEMITPGSENQIMHAELRIGGTLLMVSDGRCSQQSNFQGFALSLSPADAAEADRLFNALGEGGQVQMPLEKTFWSPCFGMVADRFGVSWMINVP
ncbi:MAG TPA: VOC family protein [Candidatus Competibacter sp.]|nr:VOC family protein [Candidatus Competibacteraceae bacterium]HRE55201.1 VOC family protein [Candidatus Competibacter sp.]